MNPLCKHCGKFILNADPRQKYHTDCAIEARRVLNRERNKGYRQEAKNDKTKPVKLCGDCGCSLDGYDYRCRYCADCAKKRHDATKTSKASKPSSPTPRKRHKFLTADEVSRRANALGLSYGQYSAQYGLYDNIYKGGLHI